MYSLGVLGLSEVQSGGEFFRPSKRILLQPGTQSLLAIRDLLSSRSAGAVADRRLGDGVLRTARRHAVDASRISTLPHYRRPVGILERPDISWRLPCRVARRPEHGIRTGSSILGSNNFAVSNNLDAGRKRPGYTAFPRYHSRNMIGGSPQVSTTMRESCQRNVRSENALPMLRRKINDDITLRYGVTMDNVVFLDH